MFRRVGIALVPLIALLVGCADQPDRDGETPATGGPGAGGASGFQAAAHTPFPVVSNGHGPIVRSPKISLVTFAADPRAAELRDDLTWLVGSTWFASVGADYGVSSATLATSFVEEGDAPSFALIDDVSAMLSARVESGSLPAPDDDTIYLVHYPAVTDIVKGSALSCRSYLAYHEEAVIGGRLAPFVVVPACASSFSGVSDTESASIFAAEFLLDAATNPFPRSSPAFVLGDQSSPFTSFGEEVGDLCPFLLATIEQHRVPRAWSISAAATGLADPCVPVTDSEPMFGVTAEPATVQMAAAGETVSFVITAWSAAALGPIHVKALPLRSDVVAPSKLGADTLDNGSSTTLEVTIPKDAPSQSVAAVIVVARTDSGDLHTWPVSVYVP